MADSTTIELDVVNAQGEKVATRAVSADVFAVEANQGILHQVVRWQRARKRAGTHKTKTRTEVRGGGRKPWRQKGTGRARAGSSSSPLWVGGGVAHGPRPKDYGFRLNKRERRLALTSALSTRVKAGKLQVLRSFELEEIKTKQARLVLNALGLNGEKVVVVLGTDDETSAKSLRNLEKTIVVGPEGLNVYDVLNANSIVILESALDGVEARFG